MFDHPDSPMGRTGRPDRSSARRSNVTCAAALLLLAAVPAARADFIWTGAGEDLQFSNDDNWLDGMAPPFDLEDDVFIFGPNGGTDQRPNLGGEVYFNIASLSFTDADASYTIAGIVTSSLGFSGDAEIVNDSTFEQRISVDVFVTGDSLTINAQDGDLFFDDEMFLLGENGNGAELLILGDNDTSLLDQIFGSGGSLFKDGAGTLTLEGANAYGGGTELAAGNIVLGSNQAFGFGDLNVTGDASLESDANTRSIATAIEIDPDVELTILGDFDLRISGVISGEGSLRVALEKLNDVLDLTRINSFEGGVILERGTIRLSNGNALGTAESLVLEGNGGLESGFNFNTTPIDIELNDNRLTLRGDNNLVFQGVITGTGGLVIDSGDDTAIFTFERDQLYTGVTEIRSGELRLLNDIESNVRMSGGRLTGNGAINGELTVGDGGTVAPGDSLGTEIVDRLRIEGDYIQRGDGTYEVDLDVADLTSDLLRILGTAQLDEDSIVVATITGEGYIPTGQIFDVYDADGGVTDDGIEIDFSASTLTLTLTTDPGFDDGDVLFGLQVLRAADAYSTPAMGANNLAIAGALDSLIPQADADPEGPVGDLLGALDQIADEEEYNIAVRELSPLPYNSMPQLGIANARSFAKQQSMYLTSRRLGLSAWEGFDPYQVGRESLSDVSPWVLAANAAQDDSEAAPAGEDPWDPKWSSYVLFQGTFTDVESGSRRTGYESSAVGGQLGLDYALSDEFIVGASVGYTYTNADWDRSLGDIDIGTIRFGPYATFIADNWFIDASVTFGYSFFDTSRNINTTREVAEADYDGWEVSAYGGFGYDIDLTENLVLTPMASIQYSYFNYGGFDESGGGGADLSVDGFNTDSLRTRLSALLSYYIDIGAKIQPYGFVAWEHEYLDQDDPLGASFAAGGGPFQILTDDANKDSFILGIGVSALFTYNFSGFVTFERDFGDDVDTSLLTGGLSLVF